MHNRHIRNTGRSKPVPDAWTPHIAAFLRYLAAKGSPDTTRNTRRQQIERAARALAPLAPETVTLDVITNYLASQQWSTETLRGHRNALRSFFAWMTATGRLDTDPTAALPIVPAAQPAPRPAPDRVVTAMTQTTTDPRTKIMLRLAAELGLRRAEVAAVHAQHLEDEDTGPILRVKGKGGKIRRIPVSDDLANIIEEGARSYDPHSPRGGFLFPGRIDGHLSPRYVGELCAEAMPGVWTMHTLRHRFATRAYRGTRNLRAVQELLGHSSVATTQRYTAVDEDELRAAMIAAA